MHISYYFNQYVIEKFNVYIIVNYGPKTRLVSTSLGGKSS